MRAGSCSGGRSDVASPGAETRFFAGPGAGPVRRGWPRPRQSRAWPRHQRCVAHRPALAGAQRVPRRERDGVLHRRARGCRGLRGDGSQGRDLRWVVLFATVATEESFSRAAVRLNIAQPWLSAQIRKLELELGISLFQRSSSGVEMTPEGRALLPLALQISESAAKFRSLARTMDAQQLRVVRIGSHVPAQALNNFIEINDTFSRLHSDYSLTIDQSSTPELLAQLRNRQIHIALVLHPFESDDLECLTIEAVRPYLLVPRTVQGSGLSLSALNGLPIAVPSEDLQPEFFRPLFSTLAAREANVNTSGAATIDASQAQGYVTNFKAADPDNDGTLSKTEFQAACAKGRGQNSASSGAASGTEGSDFGFRDAAGRGSSAQAASVAEAVLGTSSVRCERLGRPLRAAQVRWRLDHSAASTTGSCSLRTTGCPSIPDGSRAPSGRVLRTEIADSRIEHDERPARRGKQPAACRTLFSAVYLGVSAVVTAILVGFDLTANSGVAIGVLVAATATAARKFVSAIIGRCREASSCALPSSPSAC